MPEEFTTLESEEHEALCEYIRYMHPDVIYVTDGSGVDMHPIVAGKFAALRSVDSEGNPVKPPDIYVFKRSPMRTWGALMMELKRTGTELYQKDGKTFKTEHLAKQAGMLEKLEKEGYYATFVLGLEAGIETVENYLAGKYD